MVVTPDHIKQRGQDTRWEVKVRKEVFAGNKDSGGTEGEGEEKECGKGTDCAVRYSLLFSLLWVLFFSLFVLASCILVVCQ